MLGLESAARAGELMATKYVSIPVPRPGAWQPSALNPGTMIPVFDQITLLREDYERIMAGGGQAALRQYLDERWQRGAAVN